MSHAMVTDIKRFAVHDGDGIRTTVFLKGCSLRCIWCHNPEGLLPQPQLAYYAHKCHHCGTCAALCAKQAHKMEDGTHRFDPSLCIGCGNCVDACPGDALKLYGRRYTPEEILPLLLEDREFYESSGGGVTISGGECLLYPDFCAELLSALRKEGIHTAIDTCGFVPRAAIDRILPFTDRFLYDIKAFHEKTHIRCTGQSNRLILDNLEYLCDHDAEVEIRIPYVPNYNDGEMDAILSHLRSIRNIVKIRILPYHNYAASKYEALSINNTLPSMLPDTEEIEALQKIADEICK